MRQPTSLYLRKAEFFRTLGHPARVRILEVLATGERSVSELQPDVGLEASHLSQQLGVLRRAGVVATRRQGTSVIYALVSDEIAELLSVARRVLGDILNEQAEMLNDLEGTGDELAIPAAQ